MDVAAQWPILYPKVAPNAELQLFDGAGASRTLVLQLRSAPTWDAKSKALRFPRACVTFAGDGADGSRALSSFTHGGLFLEDGAAPATRTIKRKKGGGWSTEMSPALTRAFGRYLMNVR